MSTAQATYHDINQDVAADPDVRRSGIGMSDMPVILGISNYKTRLELAEEKLGRVAPFQGNRFTEAGNRLEDVIAHWYADETGYKIARANQTFRLPGNEFMMAHIDRRVLNERKVLECKSADRFTLPNWGPSGTDEIPDSYLIQVQGYTMFPNWDSADVAALIGGNDFRIYPDIIPDEELQGMMLEAARDFWAIIQRGDLPKPSNESDTRRMWPIDNGSSIMADYQVMELVSQLNEAKAKEKEIKKKIESLKTGIQCFMADNTTLVDEDGKKLHTWKDQASSSFNAAGLQESYPEIFSACLSEQFDRGLCKSTYPELYREFQNRTRVFR